MLSRSSVSSSQECCRSSDPTDSNYNNYFYQNASVGVGRKSPSRQNVGARNSVGGGAGQSSRLQNPDTEKERSKCSKFEHLLRKDSRIGNLNLKAFLFYFLIQTFGPILKHVPVLCECFGKEGGIYSLYNWVAMIVNQKFLI